MKKLLILVILTCFPFTALADGWFYAAPAAAGCSGTDAFDGSENPLATGWTTLTDATGGVKEASGVAIASASGPGIFASYWDSCAPTANQYSQAKATGYSVFVAVRMQTDNDTMYFAGRSSGANYVIELWKYVNGTYVGGAPLGTHDLETAGEPSYGAGKVIRLEATGTSTTNLRVLYDGIEIINVNDSSTPIESGRVGIFADQDLSGTLYLDDWAGGDL